MASEKLNILDKMSEGDKKSINELNGAYESASMVEVKDAAIWQRPQKRHFPQAYQCAITAVIKEPIPKSDRSSWIELAHHKEKRHFQQKNNDIFG
ncbi:spermatogenesis-associated protein 45 [Tachyglossus aculeatus]|uniref:spermatogenesis-associated protein 45 n=1 Tax=Tachyglossus aculeatus TaxID=9261 RepID=UPI0018F79DEF|nr:spermatogenesis-associated protein 45 [Tachyglossus aculeatus]